MSFSDFLNTASTPADLLMVFFTGGIFLTGLGSLFIALYLAWENRILRKAGTEPDIVAYLAPDRQKINVMHFFLANVGRGPAFDVSLEVDGAPEDLAERGVRLPVGPRHQPITALPQDKEISFYFGMAHQLLSEPEAGDVTGSVTFKNARGRVTRRPFSVNVDQFKGFRWVSPNPQAEIAKSLDRIEGHLREIGSGRRRMSIVSGSPADWEAEDRREMMEWTDDEPKDMRSLLSSESATPSRADSEA